MLESQIVAEIESMALGNYSQWYIGITADPEQRKIQHGNPLAWRSWNAESESTARRIEKRFVDLGMHGDTGGGYNPIHVYIFQPR